jgi:hypothetical protein
MANGRRPPVVNFCSGRKTTVDKLLVLIKRYWATALNIRFSVGTPGDQFGSVWCSGVMEANDITSVEIDKGIRKTINHLLNE